MKQITKDFTYDIPDDYLAQTNSNGDTATASYTGPEKLWVFVAEATGANKSDCQQMDENWDDNGMPAPPGEVKVELDCAGADTLLCAIFLPHTVDLTQKGVERDLPEGYGIYIHPWPPYPDHAYERELIKYNEDTADVSDTPDKVHRNGDWTLTWKQPWITWETQTQLRNSLLDMSDGKVSFDQPASVKDPWVTYRQKLRDIPVVFKRGEADEWPAHMVKMPPMPTMGGYSESPAPDGQIEVYGE